MEHLNRLVKDAVKNLGTNKTEKAICRVGRVIGTIATVVNKFDQDNFSHHLQEPIVLHALTETEILLSVNCATQMYSEQCQEEGTLLFLNPEMFFTQGVNMIFCRG